MKQYTGNLKKDFKVTVFYTNTGGSYERINQRLKDRYEKDINGILKVLSIQFKNMILLGYIPEAGDLIIPNCDSKHDNYIEIKEIWDKINKDNQVSEINIGVEL